MIVVQAYLYFLFYGKDSWQQKSTVGARVALTCGYFVCNTLCEFAEPFQARLLTLMVFRSVKATDSRVCGLRGGG